jgi:hypothetical protein
VKSIAGEAGSVAQGRGSMQQDRELLRMAAFKLKEAARRLKDLSREAKAPRSRTLLSEIAAELGRVEARLLQEGPDIEADEGVRPVPNPPKR